MTDEARRTQDARCIFVLLPRDVVYQVAAGLRLSDALHFICSCRFGKDVLWRGPDIWTVRAGARLHPAVAKGVGVAMRARRERPADVYRRCTAHSTKHERMGWASSQLQRVRDDGAVFIAENDTLVLRRPCGGNKAVVSDQRPLAVSIGLPPVAGDVTVSRVETQPGKAAMEFVVSDDGHHAAVMDFRGLVRVVAADTGVELWRIEPNTFFVEQGGRLVALGNGGTMLLAAVQAQLQRGVAVWHRGQLVGACCLDANGPAPPTAAAAVMSPRIMYGTFRPDGAWMYAVQQQRTERGWWLCRSRPADIGLCETLAFGEGNRDGIWQEHMRPLRVSASGRTLLLKDCHSFLRSESRYMLVRAPPPPDSEHGDANGGATAAVTVDKEWLLPRGSFAAMSADGLTLAVARSLRPLGGGKGGRNIRLEATCRQTEDAPWPAAPQHRFSAFPSCNNTELSRLSISPDGGSVCVTCPERHVHVWHPFA